MFSNVLVQKLLAVLLLGLLVGPGRGQAQSKKLAPGSNLPAIEAPLQRVSGASVSVASVLGKNGTVFLFWSNQCPWVDRYEGRVQILVEAFRPSGIQVVLVNANDPSKVSEETLQSSRERANQRKYQMSYVHDPKAALARTLGAARTPHAFLVDGQRTLVYAGAIDDSPSDPDRVQHSYLRDAISALLDGHPPDVRTTEAFGCTIKYPE